MHLVPHPNLRSNTSKAKKVVSYAESEDDDDEDAFDPAGISTKRQRARKPVIADDDDEDDFAANLDGAVDEDGKDPNTIHNT
jgi:DNA mismatch repair protein MSH6